MILDHSKIAKHVENQKYADYVQPLNQNVFEIHNTRITPFVSDWTSKRILDFGCNIGGFLNTAGSRLPHSNIVGVDVSAAALDVARTRYPNAEWIHYDRVNPTFNPCGTDDADFDIEPVDIVICYGVFTHCDFTEIQKLLTLLKSKTKPGGLITFSVWLDTHVENYLTFVKNSFGVDVPKNIPNCKESIYLLNRTEFVVDRPSVFEKHYDWIETFYNEDFLKDQLPGIFHMPGNVYTFHPIYGMINDF